MSQPYLGEIRMFGGNFAPRSNAQCNGQIMSIQQNSALFSLLGTSYGGNGTSTFALPDLRSRLPVHFGQGPGLSTYTLGEQDGTESVTLNINQIPMHSHPPTASTTPANSPTPAASLTSALAAPWTRFWVSNANKTGNPDAFNAAAVEMAGHTGPHENRMPALAITFIIALQGIFPSRN